VAASNLTLVLPPLSFSTPENDQLISLLEKNTKPLRHLRRILARGDTESFATQELMLAEIFGLPYTDANQLPRAAITATGSGFDAAMGYWLHAEPVHLHPDLDHVLLFDSSSFELAKKELGQLVEELKFLFEESGLSVHFGKQNSLFIRINDHPKVLFAPLNDVSGKNILQHLPEGDDSAYWRRLQNEIQMQMAQSSVNQQREECGAMTVNGLWFWGGGYLLRAKHAHCYDVVSTTKLFIRGLASITDAVIEKDSNNFDDIDMTKKTLVTIDESMNTTEKSLSVLLDVEQRWLRPALEAIQKKELESLILLTGHTKITISQKSLKRFWKRAVRIENMARLLS